MARNKTYICFDADTDLWAYKFMKGWKALDNIDFDFDNAHELNNLRDGSSEQTIKAKLRERLKNTKIMLVLVGENTKNLHKFVRWEQEVALAMGIPIVAVYLNGSKGRDTNICPPIIRDELVLHIPYKLATCRWAIDNWPVLHAKYEQKKETSAYHLTIETLSELLNEK
jgi:hypothetical protein